jgi:hypothetical protein
MSLVPVREHPRVGAGFLVKLKGATQSVVAQALDLSLAGMRLVDPGFSETHPFDATHVEMTLPGESVSVKLPIRVARREADDHLALSFTDLDWDDLITLARYLSPRLP